MAKQTKARVAQVECPKCGHSFTVREAASKETMAAASKELDTAFDKLGESFAHVGKAFKTIFGGK